MSFFLLQSKYREGGRRRLSQSFYSQLPQTAETRFAKSVAALHSQVSRVSRVRSARRKPPLKKTLSFLLNFRSSTKRRAGGAWPPVCTRFCRRPWRRLTPRRRRSSAARYEPPGKCHGKPPPWFHQDRVDSAQLLSMLRVRRRRSAKEELTASSLVSLHQVKYREDGRKEMSLSLYSLLPETIATQHAREAAHLQSHVCR